MDKRNSFQVRVPAWTLTKVLDGAPLPTNASIRDFQEGRAGYVANAMEQALLLPRDMADLRSLRKHEVFISLKRDLALVSLLIGFFPFILFYFDLHLLSLTFALFLP